MTNAEKFKEVFGREPNIYTCPFTTVGCNGDCEWFRASGGCYRTFWSYQYERTPTIPLSVIEKIKAEIDNDRLCYAEELQKPLKKKHTLYELKEYTARQELLSMKCAICQDVLDIIDKAVKEIEHEHSD